MTHEQLDGLMRQTRLREQEEERRRRKVAADRRLQQQERQAQDEARLVEVCPAEEQRYSQLPQRSHTGIR